MFCESNDAYRNKMIELRKELVIEFTKLNSPYRDGPEVGVKIVSFEVNGSKGKTS